MRTRPAPEVLYIARRSAPTVPAPPPALDLSRPGTLCRRDLTAELALGWERALLYRPAAGEVALVHWHHGVSAPGPVVLSASHAPKVLAAIASVRRGEAVMARLSPRTGPRYYRLLAAAGGGLRLREHLAQNTPVGPRCIPLDARELDALEHALVALATAEAA